MVVLITGSTGFIGKTLAEKLSQAGHKIKMLDRQKTSNSIPGEQIIGDLGDKEALLKATKDVDVVYHLAAIRESWGVSDEDFWQTNVIGTENLLEASLKNKVKQFVYCSSVAVIGDYFAHTIYTKTKKEAEKLVKQYGKKGLDFTIIRPTINYGPGEKWGMMTKMCLLVQNHKYLLVGNGQNYFHITYVDDTIRGFMKVLLEKKAYGQTYTIASSKPIKHIELVNIVADELGCPISKLYVPAFIAYPVAWVTEKIYNLLKLKKEPLINVHKVDVTTKDQIYDVSKAKNELGFVSEVDYQEGIRNTIKWYKKMKMIK